MRVIVCGSRGRVSAADWLQLHDELVNLHDMGGEFVIIHGACPNSADELADEWAQQFPDWAIVLRYPADWDKYGGIAGRVRNEKMLDLEDPDGVLALWDGESKGTLHMITEATKRGIPVKILPPYAGEEF